MFSDDEIFGEPARDTFNLAPAAVRLRDKLPEFKPAIPIADLHRNLEINMARGVTEHASNLSLREKFVVICGAAASITEQVELLKTLRADPRCYMLAIKGMWRWLVEHGIKPDAAIMIDPHESQIKYLDGFPDDIGLYLASQCDPAVFDKFAGHPLLTMIHTSCKPAPDALMKKWRIAGSVGTGSHAIALMADCGTAEFHLFGMDCCVPMEDHGGADKVSEGHAYKLERYSPQREGVWFEGCELRYASTPVQAAEYEYITNLILFHPEYRFFCHSYGLLRDGLADMQKIAFARVAEVPAERCLAEHMLRPGLAGGFDVSQICGPRLAAMRFYDPATMPPPADFRPPELKLPRETFGGANSVVFTLPDKEEQAA